MICQCVHQYDVQEVAARDVHLQELKIYIIHSWPQKDVSQDIQKYWPIKHDLAMIDGMAKQVSNNTISIADADIEKAKQQPHMN